MEFIGKYRELNPSYQQYDSMKDHFSEDRYPNQDRIIDYLKNGITDCARIGVPRDVFTGETIRMEELGMNDGVYTWFNTLAYYVDRYNLVLPEKFVAHILDPNNDIRRVRFMMKWERNHKSERV